MSKTIDERVVEMRFDNSHFEQHTKETMSTLDKLKQKLNLNGASKGLENINTAANKVNMNGMSNAIESVRSKFSALEVMSITALANITNSAVNAGKRIVSALTIDPIKTGFQEYETQINSIQTVLANTQSKGTTLDDVNKALDELNHYADKTIYNFTEMTRNIGTFTAAGIDLKTSTSAIQGIANLAAVSGSSSQQASVAMYQLSQALASGTVKLMDWNSVVNAGMGGQVFQDALKKTARAHGVAVDKIIKEEGSFRESLQKGWITSEILTETLSKMTQSGAAEYLSKLTGISQEQIEATQKLVDTNKDGTASYEEIAEQMAKTGKISKEEAKEILTMADTATNAATKVKTFSQLWDTLKEAAQSGWTQSWEIMIGDFEEAKELMTNISDVVSEMLNKSSEARNKVLQEWKDQGGRTAILDSFKNVFTGIGSIVKPVKEAFKDIFPSITAKQLVSFSEGLRDLTAKLKVSAETADKIKRTFKGLFSIFDIGKKGLTAVFKPLLEFATGSKMSSIGDGILNITASIGDFFTKLNESSSVGNAFKNVAEGISKALNFMGDAISSVLGKFDSFKSVFSKIGDIITKFAGIVKNVLGKAFTWIKENISGGDVLAGLTGAGIFISLKKLAELFGKVSGFFDKIGDTVKDFFKSSSDFKEVMGSIKDTLTSFQQGIKVASLVGIAVAITLLSSSIRKLSELNVIDIAVGLGAMQLMMMELNAGFASLCKTLATYPVKGTLRASIALIAMAEAINILATAMKKIGELSLTELAKGLSGVLICIKALSKAMETMSSGKNVITARDSIALIAMAEACKILADAISSIGSLPWDQWALGLGGMIICIGTLTAAMKILSKNDHTTLLRDSVAFIALATACKILGSAIKDIGSLPWDQWALGLGGMIICIGTLTAAMKILSKNDHTTLLRDSIALIAMAQSCKMLAKAISAIGSLTWAEWGRGLIGMSVCITALTASIVIISKTKNVITVRDILAFLGIAEACKMLANAIENIGYLEWNQWGRGLLGIGACVTALTAAIVIISKTKNVITVRDILAFIGIATACKILASALVEIGSMSWDGVAKGLVGMGVALGELTGVTVLLGKFVGGKALLGAAAVLVVSFSLNKIADALIKIGSMSWSEIWRGLVGMGLALTELGVVCGLLGYFTNVAGLVGAGTILLAVQGLDQLANALIKFGSMSWDEIGRGLAAMGGALGEIGLGGILNTLSGLGAINIAIIAEPLGTLADSFKKWGEIDYDTISNGLKTMNIAFAEIAAGSLMNTLSGLGSLNIAIIAEPLGTLADSIKKWQDVVIPEGLGAQLAQLAGGIMSFTFDGLGASALATAAPGIGQMADSIKKWQDVTVPEGLKEGLTNIADGIKSFSWAFMGGFSLSTITGPLGDLASSISKWKDITVPEGIKEGLTNIADGIKSFSWAFMGGFSLYTIVGPLGDLADTVKKWADVTVPEGIKDGLKNIADGINEFSIIGAAKLVSIAEPLNTLGNAFKKFSSLSVDTSNMTTVADNIKTCCDKLKDIDTTSVSNASGTINKLISMLSKVNGVNVSNVGKFVEAANKLNDIHIDKIDANTGALKSAINAIKDAMKSIESSIKNSKSGISSAMKDAVSGMDGAVKSVKGKTDSSIKSIVSSMISKIKGKKSEVTSAFKTLVSGAADGIKNKKQSFVSAGKQLGEGLVKGINAKKTDAYNAGYALGKAAVQGEKDGQQSKSPSKLTYKAGIWLGEGLVNGIVAMGQKVSNAGRNMGETVTNNISNALDTAMNLLNSDIDSQPTIRPVLDLSDVESGAGYLSSMFNNRASLAVATNLGAISSRMNNRIQNGTNDDVISAINKLGKNLSNVGGDTYNINGVTYDDGSNITEAVKTLVRAANIERRV